MSTVFFNKVLPLFLLLVMYDISCAQGNDVQRPTHKQPTLEEMVKKSDVIVEGNVVEVNCFDIKAVRRILYAKIRITKTLKAGLTDSIIYLITDGGTCNGAYVIASDGFVLSPKDEGIFLLMKDTSALKYSLPVQLYYPFLGQKSFIRYNQDYPAGHRAYGFTTPYDDIETELFQHIESVTKTPRKVLGPNLIEAKTEKEIYQNKRTSAIAPSDKVSPHANLTLEDKIAKSDAVIEGEIQNVTYFLDTKNNVYTSSTIRVSRIFKGGNKDTTIELITDGGIYPNGASRGSLWGTAAIGQKGIFFLRLNDSPTHSKKKMQSYFYLSPNSLIEYGDYLTFYENKQITDMDTDLFRPIEAITHSPVKVLGPNMFETEAAKKQNK